MDAGGRLRDDMIGLVRDLLGVGRVIPVHEPDVVAARHVTSQQQQEEELGS
jgi:hypothetical protein